MATLNELANKWGTDKGDGNYDKHNYANAYETLIGLVPDRDRPFKLLEIGIWDPRNPGASIRMWREFLPNAQIVGVDINEGCKVLEAECSIKTYILDQGDIPALEKMMAEVGEVDFVVDDGSHVLHHQITSLGVLWRYLAKDGFYCIEDLHALQSQPKERIVEVAHQNGIVNHMWLSEKLLVFRKA